MFIAKRSFPRKSARFVHRPPFNDVLNCRLDSTVPVNCTTTVPLFASCDTRGRLDADQVHVGAYGDECGG